MVDTLPSTADILCVLHSHLVEAELAGCKPYTKAVADELAALAPKGVQIYGRQFDGRPEYLCDQVWGWESRDDWDSYRGLALVMECEWNKDQDERLIDFCKVLDVAADRRIFVGQARPETFKSVVYEEMVPLMKNHKFVDGVEVGVVLAEVGGEERVDAWLVTSGGADLVLEG